MYFALALVFILSLCKNLDACSCLPAHPQTHYCKSDYVLLVKVKNSKIVPSTYGDAQMIQIKIKKTFKASDKSNIALKRGRIWSAKDDGLCGVSLKPNVKYLVTGRVDGGKAFIYSCDYYQEWSKLTTKQKKGFRLLYQQGCECKVALWPRSKWSSKAKLNDNTCAWDTALDLNGDCQAQQSICMPQVNGQCQWNKSRNYKKCMKEREKRKKLRQQEEP